MSNINHYDKYYLSNEYTYDNMILTYTTKDAIIALLYYCFCFLIINLTAFLVIKTGISMGDYVQFINLAVCIFLVKYRKQNLASIGISRKDLAENILTGFAIGLIFLFINILVFNNKIQTKNIAYQIFYNFVIVAFIEELTFRGYIQSRVCTIIKPRFLAVFVVGILFAIMHVPFSIIKSGKTILEFIADISFLFQILSYILVHTFLNLLYRKFNSFIPSTILHGLINLF